MIRFTALTGPVCLAAAAAFAQNTIETDSEEGRAIIEAAVFQVGDCLVGPPGDIELDDETVPCDAEEATHRVIEVVISPFDCPDGAARLMEIGPDNASFCLEELE